MSGMTNRYTQRTTKVSESGESVYIYFVQCINGGPIKIGQTTNIKYRMDALQTGNPYLLNPILILYDCKKVFERVIHDYFESFRLRGEWYKEDIMSDKEELIRHLIHLADINKYDDYTEEEIPVWSYDHKWNDKKLTEKIKRQEYLAKIFNISDIPSFNCH